MLPITSGIPKPKSSVYGAHVPSRRKYPFDQLDVGDMFFLADRPRNNISTLATITGKKLGMTFSTRMLYMVSGGGGWLPADVDDVGAVFGIGVWRDA